MERMVTERLMYFLESRDLFSPFQNGFCRERNTMYREPEMRKAQTNKEVVVAIFFDVEQKHMTCCRRKGFLLS